MRTRCAAQHSVLYSASARWASHGSALRPLPRAMASLWAGRRCVVVGGGGNVGGYILRLLLQQDAVVTSLDLVEYVANGADKVTSIIADIAKDAAAVDAALEGQHTVFHTASIIDISPIPSPLLTSVNITGTKNVIEACRKGGVQTLIYTSSLEVVSGSDEAGNVQLIEGVEEDCPIPKRHTLPYARTKATAEALVRGAHSGGLRTCAIRPGYVLGAGCIGVKIEIIKAIARGNRYVSAMVPSSISCVHARNCAAAHLLAAERVDLPAVGGAAFFIRDFEASVVALTVKALSKTPIKPLMLPLMLAYCLAWLADRYERLVHALFAVFGWRHTSSADALDIAAFNMAFYNIIVSSRRACETLGYGANDRPALVSRDECMAETAEWARDYYMRETAKTGKKA